MRLSTPKPEVPSSDPPIIKMVLYNPIGDKNVEVEL